MYAVGVRYTTADGVSRSLTLRRLCVGARYTTADGVSLALCGQGARAHPALATAVGIEGSVTRDAVAKRISGLEFEAVAAKLGEAGLVFVKQKTFTEVATNGSKDSELSDCYVPIDGIDDLAEVPAIPYVGS